MPSKVCTKCGVEKSLDEFEIRKDRPWLRRGQCIQCIKAISKARRDARRALIKEQNAIKRQERMAARLSRTEKKCPTCQQCKPLAQFGKSCMTPDGLQYYCKMCSSKAAVEYAKAHRSEVNAARRKWAQRNRDKVNAKKHRYNARKRGLPGDFSSNHWQEIKTFWNNTCLCCGRQEPEISLTADHVMPLALGGVNSADNIQPLCKPCNSRKGATYVDYRSSHYATQTTTDAFSEQFEDLSRSRFSQTGYVAASATSQSTV